MAIFRILQHVLSDGCLDKRAGQPVPRLRGCGAAQASHLQEPGR